MLQYDKMTNTIMFTDLLIKFDYRVELDLNYYSTQYISLDLIHYNSIPIQTLTLMLNLNYVACS